MAKVNCYVLMRNPETGEPFSLAPGDDVPEWAKVDAELLQPEVETKRRPASAPLRLSPSEEWRGPVVEMITTADDVAEALRQDLSAFDVTWVIKLIGVAERMIDRRFDSIGGISALNQDDVSYVVAEAVAAKVRDPLGCHPNLSASTMDR